MRNSKLFIIVYILLFTFSCSTKSDWASFEITDVQYITSSSFVLTASIGEGLSTDYGVTISESKGIVESDSSVCLLGNRDRLIGWVSQLKPDHTYYLHTFLKHGNSITFGSPFKVHTMPAQYFIDPRDGNRYEIATIGNQCWMVDNLRYNTPGSCYYNNDSIHNFSSGRLYSKEEAIKACPAGWHLSTDDEWKEVEVMLGVPANELNSFNRTFINGYGLSLLSFDMAQIFNDDLTNKFSFNLLPTGTYSINKKAFMNSGFVAYFWSHNRAENEFIIRTINGNGTIHRSLNENNFKYSIRCVRNN